MSLLHFYRRPCLTEAQAKSLLARAQTETGLVLSAVESEYCFNVELDPAAGGSKGVLESGELKVLSYLLRETYEPSNFADKSFLAQADQGSFLIEVGPRMTFTTAWSSNAVSILRSCGLSRVSRIERSRRYRFTVASGGVGKQAGAVSSKSAGRVAALLHDRMTEMRYPSPLTSFSAVSGAAGQWATVRVVEEGEAALERASREGGYGFDKQDIKMYAQLFRDVLKRNPTTVELFDMAQSNSEHSRHWFFGGKMVIDGKEKSESLFKLVKKPHTASKPNNSVIAFHDNSSALLGAAHPRAIPLLVPDGKGLGPARMRQDQRKYHLLLTAETHNFPSGIAPFPGAETGTGGRLRDTHATGAGSLVQAGTAGYCVGNLNIPGYALPWEDPAFRYPGNKAPPLQIKIEASNGASDYGNKFGEPVIQGFARSFGLRVPAGVVSSAENGTENTGKPESKNATERMEWIKPIMFTAGLGQIDDAHLAKGAAEKGMLIVKIGGPAYRIGMGGGAASSMFQGENAESLDFDAVQRGDAEMFQRVNRVIRACVELGASNPIVSIHDQGAGGNGNVLKEICEPAGGRIDLRKLLIGDPTMSAQELWGAEYQENDALLLRPESLELFTALCARERAPFSVVGTVTGDGRIVVVDSQDNSKPVDLDLKHVLGKLPPKTFTSRTVRRPLRALSLPKGLTISAALDRVLRLVSVGSKRYLTNKVDRSVTGLIAQQQCVGPLQLPLSDVAVTAQSYLGLTGAAMGVGEQPIKGLLNPAAMARMSVAEALSNIVWAKLTAIKHIKASGNWMWPAKFEGGAADMYSAAEAMSALMIELGIALDGGKDSLSMAASAPGEPKPVKCPGSLVISAYCSVPDVRAVVTPDLETRGQGGKLLLVTLNGRCRMGGSALSHTYGQLGRESPDVDSAAALLAALETIQELVEAGDITAGHDRSDGGLVTALLEMGFAGNAGFDVDVDATAGGWTEDQLVARGGIDFLFNEEVGFVMEAPAARVSRVLARFAGDSPAARAGVRCSVIGTVANGTRVTIRLAGRTILDADVCSLRDTWEATSFELEARQADPACVAAERKSLASRKEPPYRVTFSPARSPARASTPHRVAVVRQEGSNGDREMLAAFHAAGFEAWDVHMSDLTAGRADLAGFRGVAFVGGFSYADVLGSAKGWAGTIRHDARLVRMFRTFYERKDTFSLGVCNGCQLMALLGWVPSTPELDQERQPRFVHNRSGRFESRWSTVRIEDKSNAIMLRGMGGSVLGVWVAHGEGRALFPDEKVYGDVEKNNQVPLRYVDDGGKPTEAYPFNPNGSVAGVAGLTSRDGRHLAMMPHPERCFLKWQWPYTPSSFKNLDASPWLRMFQNARVWCEEQRR